MEQRFGASARAAHDVVHVGAGDGGIAVRRRAGRRSHPAVVHVRLDGERLPAARGDARCSSTCARTRSTSTSAGASRRSRRARRSSCRCTTPASAARWMSSAQLARRHSLLVVEDAAQAVNATYRGAYLGTLGTLGAYSFHETKNFICGEGGALLVNDAEPRGAGRDHPREGHESQPLLPRPGGQVHVGRRRLVVRAGRHPGGAAADTAAAHGTRSLRGDGASTRATIGALQTAGGTRPADAADRSRRTAARTITCST